MRLYCVHAVVSMLLSSICARCSLFCRSMRELRSASGTELISPCRDSSLFSFMMSDQCSSGEKDGS